MTTRNRIKENHGENEATTSAIITANIPKQKFGFQIKYELKIIVSRVTSREQNKKPTVTTYPHHIVRYNLLLGQTVHMNQPGVDE